MIKNIKDAFTRKKRSKKSITIAYTIASVVAVSSLTIYLYRDNIASWWKEIHKEEIIYSEEDLGEVPEVDDKDVAEEIKEYISDENGITYLKTKIASLGYVAPIPVETDISKENKWEVFIEAGKTIVVNKDYNGKYGNIEYGIIKIDPTQTFTTMSDLKNQTIGKISSGMVYHGYNTRYRSVLIQDSDNAAKDIDENTIEMLVNQNFSDEKQSGYYSNFNSKYIFTKIEGNYFIIYTIAPPSKMGYAEKMLTLVKDNVYMYNQTESSDNFFIPSAYTGKTFNVGNGNVQIPTNLKNCYGSTFITNDDISSPLAQTYVTITRVAKTTNKISDFNNELAVNYACMLGNVKDYTQITLNNGKIKNLFCEEVASERTTYNVTGEFAYSSSELVELVPFSDEIKYTGYIINVDSESILIAGTYTSSNKAYVDQYLKNICNTFSVN